MEEVIEQGGRVPLSRKIMVEEEMLLNIIEQMRISIPQEIKKAREVQDERERFIAQAHEEARRIVAQAREDAAQQLDERKLRQEIEGQTTSLLKRAQLDADRIRVGADDYAEQTLKDLGQRIGQLQAVVQNGLEALSDRRAKRASRGSVQDS